MVIRILGAIPLVFGLTVGVLQPAFADCDQPGLKYEEVSKMPPGAVRDQAVQECIDVLNSEIRELEKMLTDVYESNDTPAEKHQSRIQIGQRMDACNRFILYFQRIGL